MIEPRYHLSTKIFLNSVVTEYRCDGGKKELIDISIEGGNIATSTGEKYRSLGDTYSFLLLKVSIIILCNLNFRHIFGIFQSLTPSETTSLRVLVTRRYVSLKFMLLFSTATTTKFCFVYRLFQSQ